MEKIKSFTVDHDKLKPGLYLSRTDRNAVTYDLRLTVPNEEFLPGEAMHTMEHITATYLRNSGIRDSVIYFGPMGCQTGFYLVVFDDVSHARVIEALKEAFAFTASYTGQVPGTDRVECGNYRYHNLEWAKTAARRYLATLEQVSEHTLRYPE